MQEDLRQPDELQALAEGHRPSIRDGGEVVGESATRTAGQRRGCCGVATHEPGEGLQGQAEGREDRALLVCLRALLLQRVSQTADTEADKHIIVVDDVAGAGGIATVGQLLAGEGRRDPGRSEGLAPGEQVTRREVHRQALGHFLQGPGAAQRRRLPGGDPIRPQERLAERLRCDRITVKARLALPEPLRQVLLQLRCPGRQFHGLSAPRSCSP